MSHLSCFPTGQLCLASALTKSEFVNLEYLNSTKIINVCTSDTKLFIIFDDSDGIRQVTPLHSQEIDEFDPTLTQNTTFSKIGEPTFRSIDFYSQTGNLNSIVSSKSITLLINEDAETFISGFGYLGALGLGVNYISSKPISVPKLKHLKVVNAAIGDNHGLALTQMGDVYSWGRGIEGQLGLDHFQVSPYPSRVNFFDHLDPKSERKYLQQINDQFLTIQQNNLKNDHKINSQISKLFSPRLSAKTHSIENNPPISNHIIPQHVTLKNSNCNNFRSMSISQLPSESFYGQQNPAKARTSVNAILPYFNQNKTQKPQTNFEEEIKIRQLKKLAHLQSQNNQQDEFLNKIELEFSFDVISLFERVKIVELHAVGNHSFALTNFRTMYSWGENLCGQLGLPIKSRYTIPQFLAIPEPVFLISCQKTHTLLISTHLNLFAAGLNNYYQTGLGQEKSYHNFQKLEVDLDGNELPRFKTAATTSTYSIAISVKNQVYCWGKCFLESTPKTMYPRKKTFPGINSIFSLHATSTLILLCKQPGDVNDDLTYLAEHELSVTENTERVNNNKLSGTSKKRKTNENDQISKGFAEVESETGDNHENNEIVPKISLFPCFSTSAINFKKSYQATDNITVIAQTKKPSIEINN